jgi:AcrR family transcriptional regulator
MPANPRLLRARADALAGGKPPLTRRQQQHHERIMGLAPALIAEFGLHNLTFAMVALALRISPAAMRHHVIDLYDLLGQILLDHLAYIADILDGVPATIPDRQAAARAAYYAATRVDDAHLTVPHYLLVSARFALPEDLLDQVQARIDKIGVAVAGDIGCKALAVLDDPAYNLAEVEMSLHALTAPPGTPNLALAWNNAAIGQMPQTGQGGSASLTPAVPPPWRPPPQHAPPPH